VATAKFKMPTDKQIWAEVDDQLAKISEAYKKLKGQPDRQDLFDKKKAFYLATPQRLEEEAKAKAAQRKKLADADAAYLAIRRAQGKPIITVKDFKADYPQIKVHLIKGYSQKKLHETYEWLGFIGDAKAIQDRYVRLQAVTNELTYKYLAKAYGLYRRIVKSEAADTAFDEIRAMLWNDYKIKTHHDIPRSSLLLKLVFEGASEKTIHLYTRSFQLADGYDVEEDGFMDFIKQIGGMEKIRKAYATVKGADAGTLITAYERDAEYSASLNELMTKDPLTVVQLSGGEAALFQNDLFGRYCLVLAHIDPMSQLELYGYWPASNVIEAEIIKRISEVQKANGAASWVKHKAKSSAHIAERLREKLVAKEEKRQEKEVEAAKKADALAKKNAAAEKRFAKQRAAQSTAKTSKPKPVAKTKAVLKTNPATKPKAVTKKK
jgi:hypothetical protein